MSNNRQSNNRQSKNRAHDDEPKCVFPNGSSGGPETSALVDEVDREKADPSSELTGCTPGRQLVVLRDNRIFVGTLRSFDQFANIVLERTFERVYVGAQFGEVPVGLFIIRGENVMLFGRLVSWLHTPRYESAGRGQRGSTERATAAATGADIGAAEAARGSHHRELQETAGGL
eukprot:TRINITY_DN2980_c0_g1_i3.p1 TRINITY_DN2980_c0_g1~~TRINITY_DN2980_c0_g1_i3.p1  ORF type:complete len:174 (+),score=38.43 TRINITY_DN2980_c0_g1_i3:208-729(+)